MTRPVAPVRRRWLANLGWIVGGVVIYAVCNGIFGGYPRWHTAELSSLVVVALVVLGAIVWYRDEHDDEP